MTNSDLKDFSRRLEDFLCSSEHKLNMTFLTPTLKGTRARSVHATSKSNTSVGKTSASNIFDMDGTEDGESPNLDKQRRSSVRRMRRAAIIAPHKFHNCEDCGAIYFRVSPIRRARSDSNQSLLIPPIFHFLRKTASP